jgi:hypothetical protein
MNKTLGLLLFGDSLLLAGLSLRVEAEEQRGGEHDAATCCILGTVCDSVLVCTGGAGDVVAPVASGQAADQAMSCERKRAVVNLVPGRGTAGTNKSSANRTKPLGIRVSAARRDFAVSVCHTLSMDSDALMNEAMNPAFEEDLEERGVKFAHPAQNLSSQEGGISCA